MTTHHVDVLVQLETALGERRHQLSRGFACHTAARRIVDRYWNAADGTSGFWIVRPRRIGNGERPSPAVYEVLRSDGRRGVWDASTPEEGDIVADVLTKLSL